MEKDINKMEQLLKDFNIPYVLSENVIEIGSGKHGYVGFYGIFYFDDNGKFIEHELTE